MSNDLTAPAAEPAQLPAVPDDDQEFLQEWESSRLPLACTWDRDSAAGRQLIIRCWSSPVLELKDVANRVLPVTGIAILRQYGKKGDEGEVEMKWKGCLVLDSGEIVKFASGAAMDSLRAIVATRGGISKMQFPIQLKTVHHPRGTLRDYDTLETVESE